VSDFEALEGLDPDEADELRRWAAWRNPWPDVVRSCADELERVEALRRTDQPVFPDRGLETEAFRRAAFEDVKVVLLGIDPYPNAKHATGLAFSVPADTRALPRAASNLRALAVRCGWVPDGGPGPTGDLTGWARQGVLLLNRALTFSPDPAKTPKQNTGAHLPIWQEWTDEVIRVLDARPVPPVFLLMGRDAEKVRPLIKRGEVVVTRHPAARMKNHVDEFLSSDALNKVNRLLAADGLDGIDWSL
jgi:uracil-DNA glycosylase